MICQHVFKALLLAILLCFCHEEAYAQDKTSQLKTLFDTLGRRQNFNGCVLVMEEGKVLFQSAYGEADKSTGRLLTTESVFEIASVSKVFTAVAIMQLKEKGLISYQDSLRKFFPGLPYHGVTILNLIAHTSGIEDCLAWTEPDINVNQANYNADIIKRLSERTPAAAFLPGTEMRYSNTNYILLASVVEKVSGMQFADYLRKNIFDPCGMQHTRIYARHAVPIPENYAFDYSWDGSANHFVRSDSLKRYTYYMSGLVGAYGIVSDAADLYKWGQALSGNLLVSEATMKEALTPVTFKGSKEVVAMAPGMPSVFAWQLLPGTPEYQDMFAAGSYGGYTSLIVRKLSKKQTIILLSNFMDNSDVTTIIDHVDEILEDGILTFPDLKKQKRGIRLSTDKLRAFSGIYKSAKDPLEQFNITLSGNRLFAKKGPYMEQNIFPESGDTFFVNGTESKLVFEPGADGQVSTLRMVGAGFNEEFTRVR